MSRKNRDRRKAAPAPADRGAPARAPAAGPAPGSSRLPLVAVAAVVVLAGLWWALRGGGGASGAAPDLLHDLVTPDMEEPVAEALGAALERVEADPDSAQAWALLGALCDAHELYAEAETCYARALALGRADLTLVYNLGVVLDYRGRSEDALAMLDRAARMELSFTPTYFRMGEAYARTGRLAEARAAFEQALSLEPDHLMSLRGLGQVLLQLDENEAALRALETVVAAAPRDRPSLSSLAQAQTRLGQSERAAATLARLRQAGTGDTLVLKDPVRFQVESLRTDSIRLKERAAALIAEGRWEEAQEPLRTLARARPDAGWPRSQLGLACLETGDATGAVEHLRAAKERLPGDAAVCYYLGQALERTGDVDAAVEQYRAAVALVPGHPAARRLQELAGR